ncbi:PaaX family transcriptional regulator [Mycobacterium vicinigordonae]|uniref:PaaX family transcriptional regulator n=1 Tax=Mycobacterium vicinigordonae TaxID=1719132 RepID=A0A7D6E6F7_9MYCO|nr:PaaX family transcriptional regulator C-terminal domain-containing protein [Mycobacterium vicinigordonae]QLL07883.1 PaaX family transcriptional regulator [Mycobacterium vicinigordonae]
MEAPVAHDDRAVSVDPTSAYESQPRELILTLFGLYARTEHNWLSVAAVVDLMSDLGAAGPLVRKSISRLKQRDLLNSDRSGGVAGYSLSPQALQVLTEGDVRIFDRSRATVDDGWLIVSFSIPESEREKRHSLRTTLTHLGFGMVAQGVWIAPGRLGEETRNALSRKNLTQYVDMFVGNYFAFGNLRAKVRQWWDLDRLSALYEEFIGRYRQVARTFATHPSDAREAFRIYIPMLTEWRRLPYLDPGLPLTLLPAGWSGVTADELFAELNKLLSAPAHEYVSSVIHR